MLQSHHRATWNRITVSSFQPLPFPPSLPSWHAVMSLSLSLCVSVCLSALCECCAVTSVFVRPVPGLHGSEEVVLLRFYLSGNTWSFLTSSWFHTLHLCFTVYTYVLLALKKCIAVIILLIYSVQMTSIACLFVQGEENPSFVVFSKASSFFSPFKGLFEALFSLI